MKSTAALFCARAYCQERLQRSCNSFPPATCKESWLPIISSRRWRRWKDSLNRRKERRWRFSDSRMWKKENSTTHRSEEHTSELQSRLHLVCRLLLEKKKKNMHNVVLALVTPMEYRM